MIMFLLLSVVFSKTQDIDRLFASFMSKYIEAIEKADFSKIAETFEDGTSLNHGVPEDIEEKTLQAKDCVSFINALKPAHCNWLNISILKVVAQSVDAVSREATELVDQFIETVYPRKVKEVMQEISNISNISMDSYTDVKETWNKDLDDVIIEDLFIHQKHLASILQIQQHTLVLQRIDSGIEMHWAIHTRLVERARQSAKSADIASYDILTLEIGGQNIASNNQYHQPVTVTEEMSG